MIQLYWFNSNNNFGDQLSPMLCQALSGSKVCYTENFQKCDLVAIGSILHIIRYPQYRGAIWGTGLIEPPTKPISFPKAKIYAVRGHLTREILNCDRHVPVGDPGLLSDLFVKSHEKKYDLGIVPHFTDIGNTTVETFATRNPNTTVINVFAGVQNVLDKIASCKAIVSSSLHGLIIADSLNIPNGWIKLSDSIIGNDFKFRDYYSIFGIDNATPIPFGDNDTVDTVVDRLANYRRDGIDRIKSELRNSFPCLTKHNFWNRLFKPKKTIYSISILLRKNA